MTNLPLPVRVLAIAFASALPLPGFAEELPQPGGVASGFVYDTTKRPRPERPYPGGPGWVPGPRCSWFRPC